MVCHTASFVLLFLIASVNYAASLSKGETKGEDISETERYLRGRRHSPSVGGKKVKGSYIVSLSGDISSYNVKVLAAKHASKMRDEVKKSIASGALSNDTQEVTTGSIFTSSINGFTLNGVPEELAQSLVNMTGVIGIEQDMIISIDDPMELNQTDYLTGDGLPYKARRLLESDIAGSSSCPQFLPWGIQRVGGPVPNSNPNGRVFVIDTGIAPNSDLNIDTTLSRDFVGDGRYPAWSDANGHGTHVSGTIAAIDNCIDVVGVVPGATLVAVRVLDSQGSGSISNVIAAVDYVASKGKSGDVANMSLGGGISTSLDQAVSNAAAKGIKFALAAGNSAQDAQYTSPARVNGGNIYTVSAIDQYDWLCSFSNYGSPVDYAAPGKKVYSLHVGGGIVAYSGTSMATPHVAGLLFAKSMTQDGYVQGDKDSTADPIAHSK